jgi:hypothetical protein
MHTIHASNLAHVEAKIAKINRRATRLGCAPVELRIVERRTEEHKGSDGEIYHLPVIDVELTGQPPRVAGFAFLASIEHTAAGNLIRVTPAHEGPIDPKWRTADPYCQHCNSRRRRKDTFLVRSEDGTTLQVGRNCLADYLGGHDPAQAIAACRAFSQADDACAEGSDFGCSGAYALDLAAYLPFVAAAIRVDGWTSRTAARDSIAPIASTADVALDCLIATIKRESIAPEYRPTEADRARAREALDWTRADIDSHDPIRLSDYQHNLSVIIEAGTVDHKRAGYAASIIGYHARGVELELKRNTKRQEARERALASRHLGAVKERLTLEGVTIESIRELASDWGVTFLYKMRAGSDALTWFSSRDQDLSVGQVVGLRGTVKKHDQYQGEAQTVLTRCKIAE